MAYRGLTTSGANYLATRLAQELPVEFTKVQIGAGTPAGNPADVTELQNYKLDAKILKKSQENNTVEITIQVVNDNVEQGFYLKEIGVFVNDDTEKLYWYCNEDNAQYIPAKTDSAIAFEIDIKMEVTNVESPILNWSGQGTWVDKDYLEEVLRNYTPNTRQMIAGKGLAGGGNFISDKTFNVVSANDGIIINEDDIQLNPVNDLSNSSTTRALAANQGLILDNKDKGIVGGYNGKFPLTSATKGNIYLLENTQKYYICITDYNGSQLTTPNANFEELSVYTNRSKLDNLQEYIIISFRDDGTYNVVKNTFNKDIIIDGNGVITLPKSQLSSIWARGKIGNKSYGFGIYENGLSSPENLIAFESKKMEDISVLTCLYSGNKIRVSNIIMSSGSASDRMNMSYTEGYSANSLKYPTVLTISTISKS